MLTFFKHWPAGLALSLQTAAVHGCIMYSVIFKGKGLSAVGIGIMVLHVLRRQGERQHYEYF